MGRLRRIFRGSPPSPLPTLLVRHSSDVATLPTTYWAEFVYGDQCFVVAHPG